MTENKYPNTGRLFPNRYKDNPKKPDITGELVMTRTALKELLQEHDEDDIVIKLSVWEMQGQKGPWLRIAWNNYKPAFQQNQPKKTETVTVFSKQQPQKLIDDNSDDIPF